jgi:hypothetical protein
MTEHQARSAGDAMAAQPDNRAIFHDRLEHCMGPGNRYLRLIRHRSSQA